MGKGQRLPGFRAGFHRFTVSVEHHTRKTAGRTESDCHQFCNVKSVNVTALEENRRGNVHENSNYYRHQFPRVERESRMRANEHSEWSHGGKEAHPTQGGRFLKTGLQEHPEKGD